MVYLIKQGLRENSANLKWFPPHSLYKINFKSLSIITVQRRIQDPVRRLRWSVIWHKNSILGVWQDSEYVYFHIHTFIPCPPCVSSVPLFLSAMFMLFPVPLCFIPLSSCMWHQTTNMYVTIETKTLIVFAIVFLESLILLLSPFFYIS